MYLDPRLTNLPGNRDGQVGTVGTAWGMHVTSPPEQGGPIVASMAYTATGRRAARQVPSKCEDYT